MVAGASRSFRDATATLPRHRARLPAPAPLAPHAPRAHRTVRWPRCSSSPCSLGALLRIQNLAGACCSLLRLGSNWCRTSDEQCRGRRVGKAIWAQTAKRRQPAAFARVADVGATSCNASPALGELVAGAAPAATAAATAAVAAGGATAAARHRGPVRHCGRSRCCLQSRSEQACQPRARPARCT